MARYTTTLQTAATIEPVTLDQAKKQCRVTIDDDDTYITDLITVARQMAEKHQARAYNTQTWRLYLAAFPASEYIELPWPPLQSVTHVKYTDSGGTQSTFASTEYIVDTDSEPGRIVLGYNKSWPTDTLQPGNAVEIQYVAGYGATVASVPAHIRQGVLMWVAHMYEYREPVADVAAHEIPFHVQTILGVDRIYTFA